MLSKSEKVLHPGLNGKTKYFLREKVDEKIFEIILTSANLTRDNFFILAMNNYVKVGFAKVIEKGL